MDAVIERRLAAREEQLNVCALKLGELSAAIEGKQEDVEEIRFVVMKEIALLRAEAHKALVTKDTAQRQLKAYEVSESRYVAEIEALTHEIEQQKLILEREKIHRSNREEYRALSREISRVPSREDTMSQIEALERELSTLKADEGASSSELDLKKKQMSLFFHALTQLRLKFDDSSTSNPNATFLFSSSNRSNYILQRHQSLCLSLPVPSSAAAKALRGIKLNFTLTMDNNLSVPKGDPFGQNQPFPSIHPNDLSTESLSLLDSLLNSNKRVVPSQRTINQLENKVASLRAQLAVAEDRQRIVEEELLMERHLASRERVLLSRNGGHSAAAATATAAGGAPRAVFDKEKLLAKERAHRKRVVLREAIDRVVGRVATESKSRSHNSKAKAQPDSDPSSDEDEDEEEVFLTPQQIEAVLNEAKKIEQSNV